MKRYIVYKGKGDDIHCMGTAQECADFMGIKLNSFKFYLTPAYALRVEKAAQRVVKRKSKGCTVVEPMEDYIQSKLDESI